MEASTSKRIFFGDVAEGLDVGVAEERIVVEGDLGVERKQLVVLGRDEGIDLDQRSIGIDEGPVEALEEADRLVDLRGLESERKCQLARLPRAEPDGGVDTLLVDGVGVFGGDFLDLHAAGLRSHKHQLAGGAIEHDAEIEFAVDGGGLLDQQALHLLPLGSGLVGDKLHAEDVFSVLLGVFARTGHLYAPAFAAAAGMNLRFDDDARGALGKEFAGHVVGFFEGIGHFAPGDGNAVLCQDLFRLILVNFQRLFLITVPAYHAGFMQFAWCGTTAC